jgi:hypothetical protein
VKKVFIENILHTMEKSVEESRRAKHFETIGSKRNGAIRVRDVGGASDSVWRK